jgi:WD40 repeat protein
LPDRERRLLVGNRRREEASAVAFAPDESQIVSAFDTRVAIWDVASRKLVNVLEGHRAAVTGVRFSADGRTIYSGDAAGSLRVWPADGSTGITRLPGDSFHARPIALAREAAAIAVAGVDTSLAVWHLNERRQTMLRKGGDKFVVAEQSVLHAISPDGRIVLDARQDQIGMTLQWDVASTSVVAMPLNQQLEPACTPPRPTRSSVGKMAFSRDGRYLAFAHGTCVGIRDMSTGTTVARLRLVIKAQEYTNLQSLLFRNDGTLITITGHAAESGQNARNVVRVWDWQAGKALLTRETPVSAMGPRNWNLAISGDGRRVALLGGVPITVSIWDAALTHEIGRVTNLGQDALRPDVDSVTLNHDGTRLATAGPYDRIVRIWDPAQAQQILALTDIDSHGGGIAFTPDGRLVAGRTSGGLTIWESRLAAGR